MTGLPQAPACGVGEDVIAVPQWAVTSVMILRSGKSTAPPRVVRFHERWMQQPSLSRWATQRVSIAELMLREMSGNEIAACIEARDPERKADALTRRAQPL